MTVQLDAAVSQSLSFFRDRQYVVCMGGVRNGKCEIRWDFGLGGAKSYVSHKRCMSCLQNLTREKPTPFDSYISQDQLTVTLTINVSAQRWNTILETKFALPCTCEMYSWERSWKTSNRLSPPSLWRWWIEILSHPFCSFHPSMDPKSHKATKRIPTFLCCLLSIWFTYIHTYIHTYVSTDLSSKILDINQQPTHTQEESSFQPALFSPPPYVLSAVSFHICFSHCHVYYLISFIIISPTKFCTFHSKKFTLLCTHTHTCISQANVQSIMGSCW